MRWSQNNIQMNLFRAAHDTATNLSKVVLSGQTMMKQAEAHIKDDERGGRPFGDG